MPAILLVDDDADDLFALSVILEPLGLEVVKAESGEEALKRLLERDFAIIIMDVMMPRMNGFETAALVRQREKNRDTPLFFLTGFDPEETRFFPGYADFSAEFIRKPIQARVLREKIKESIGRAGLV